VQYGPDYGKFCIILEIIDQNRVLVDGPTSNVLRQSIPAKRLALTDFKLNIGKGVRRGTLVKALEKDDVIARWKESSWGKREEVKQRKAGMNDFDRFKVMVAKTKRRSMVRDKLRAAKLQAS